jgi:TrmH family RNA methyltransferase
VAPLVEAARSRGIPVLAVAPHVLLAVSGVDTPQGVVAVVRHLAGSLEAVLDRPDLLLLIADRVQDPGNLGTMIRTADAAGATAVALTPGTVDPYNPKTARATMGSLFHLPVVEWPGTRLVAALRARAIRLLGTDAAGTMDYRAVDYRRPLAVVVGHEAEGLGAEWRQAADALVRIPIHGGAESLNAAVAAALVLYEAVRSVYTDANLHRQA